MHDESIALDRFARWDAWEPVVAAIEEAIDTPGLPPEQRAALAILHNDAASWIGRPPVEIDRPQRRADPRFEVYDRANEAGGVGDLRLRSTIRYALIRGGIVTVDELRRKLADDERNIRAINGIGPKALADIRRALEATTAEVQ